MSVLVSSRTSATAISPVSKSTRCQAWDGSTKSSALTTPASVSCTWPWPGSRRLLTRPSTQQFALGSCSLWSTWAQQRTGLRSGTKTSLGPIRCQGDGSCFLGCTDDEHPFIVLETCRVCLQLETPGEHLGMSGLYVSGEYCGH